MTVAAPAGASDALASPSLAARFPHLPTAMRSEPMRAHLQRALLDGTGLLAEDCAAPKVHIAGDACRLQHRLAVRDPSGARRDVLVLGTMFADPADAVALDAVRLAPLSQRFTPAQAPAPRPTAVIEPLGLAVSVYPIDARWPTLVDLTDPVRMTAVLGGVAGNGCAPRVVGVDLVRYNRTHGSVLRYTLRKGTAATVYGKVGSAGGAQAVRQGLEALARPRASRAPGSVIVPGLIGHSAELDVLFFSAVAGARPALRDVGGAAGVLDAAATSAAFLHSAGPGVGRSRTLAGELDRARHEVELVAPDTPALAECLRAILDRVTAWAGDTRPGDMVLSHGDFTPSQLLTAGRQTVLLDLDGLCRAEPAFDMGRFLAYLRVALLRSGHDGGHEPERRLFGAYHLQGGPVMPGARVRLYELVSLVLMAVHAWQRIKPAHVQLVCEVLRRRLSAAGGWATPRPWPETAASSRG